MGKRVFAVLTLLIIMAGPLACKTSAPTPMPVLVTPTSVLPAPTPAYRVEPSSLLRLEKKMTSEHFVIYFHPENENEARELLILAESDYPLLVKIFRIELKTEILLTYDPDEYVDEFNAAPPWIKEQLKDPHFAAGSFCPGCTKSLGPETEYVYLLRPKLVSFAHELSHRFFWVAYPNLKRRDDLNWLNEGLAVYVQNEVSGGPAPGGFSGDAFEKLITMWKQTKDVRVPQNFEELNEWQKSHDRDLFESFYDLSGLMVYFLANKLDDYGLRNFLSDLNQTGDLEKTFQNKLGLGVSQVYQKWHETLVKTAATSNSLNFLDNFKKYSKSQE
jgi:hypothetical protein